MGAKYRLLVLIVLLLVPGLAWAQAQGNCGSDFVRVSYSHPVDYQVACEGIERALTFFSEKGWDFKQTIAIQFSDEVLVPMLNPKGEVVSHERVYGLYDSETETIRMSSWATDYLKSRTAFVHLALDRELHTSVVTHEVTHRLHHLISKELGTDMAHGTSEFLAYMVQIATLKEPQKSKVLELWPGAVLERQNHINSMVWSAAPHKFGVMSYRFHLSHPEVLQAILDGTFYDPDRMLEGMNGF